MHAMETMMPTNTAAPDWQDWLRRWEAMMTGYVPEREQHFEIMLDAIATLLGEEIHAVDLGAGPGSTSRRLLDRFPRARCLAIDLDPALLAIGRGAHDRFGARLRWIEADLTDAELVTAAGEGAFDLAISTSAFHALPSEALPVLYQNTYRLLRAGGILLNGDTMRFEPRLERAQQLTKALRSRYRADAARRGDEDWDQLRAALLADATLGPLFQERERRFATLQPAERQIGTYVEHEAAARAAGFSEVFLIWQSLDFRVLLAGR
jgi:SAM-dependent methyltransferase